MFYCSERWSTMLGRRRPCSAGCANQANHHLPAIGDGCRPILYQQASTGHLADTRCQPLDRPATALGRRWEATSGSSVVLPGSYAFALPERLGRGECATRVLHSGFASTRRRTSPLSHSRRHVGCSAVQKSVSAGRLSPFEAASGQGSGASTGITAKKVHGRRESAHEALRDEDGMFWVPCQIQYGCDIYAGHLGGHFRWPSTGSIPNACAGIPGLAGITQWVAGFAGWSYR